MSRFLELISRTSPQPAPQVEEVQEEPVAEVKEDAPRTTRKRTKKA